MHRDFVRVSFRYSKEYSPTQLFDYRKSKCCFYVTCYIFRSDLFIIRFVKLLMDVSCLSLQPSFRGLNSHITVLLIIMNIYLAVA